MYRIIAYNPDGTEYTIYDPAGAGALPVLAPRSTEELNQPGSLEFTILDGHEAFEHLEPKKTYISAFIGDTEFFYGRLLNMDPSPLTGQLQCTCAGALSFLQDTEVPPFQKNESGSSGTQTMTAEAFFRLCISAHNADAGDDFRRTFTVGTVSHSMKNDERQYTLSSYQDTKSVLETNLINHYGGFLRIRRSNGTNFIDWVETYGDTDEGVLELGINIISILNRMVGEELYTAIRPIGKDGLVLSTNNGLIPLFPTESMEEYGRIVKSITFGDAATEAALRTKAEELVSRIQKTLVVSSEIKLLDMKFADGDEHGVNLGDMYTQIAGLEGITMIVGIRSRDFENPQNDSCTLQNPKAYEGGELTENGSGSSLSKRASRNSAGVGHAYKYIHEFDKQLQLNTDKIAINAQELAIHAQTLTETAQEFIRISHNEETTNNRLDYIEGTGVYQNSEQITDLAGKFRIVKDPNTGKVDIQLIEGSKFSIEKDGVYSDVVNADGMNSAISQTASEIRSEVSSANSQIYTYIKQTNSGIESRIVDAEQGLYNYTNETASGIRRVIINSTNQTWVQEYDPTTEAGGSHSPKDGDIWVESTHQGTWEGAEGFDWEHDEQFDWGQIQGAKIWIWANNKWELASDQQQVVSYTDVINTADHFVQQKIKGIINDEGMLEVYLSKLEQTATEIRSEVAMSDSSIYSYIHQTATNIDLGVSNRPTSIVSNTRPIKINGRDPKNGDIWIGSKNQFKQTWEAVLDDDWGNDEDLNWGEISNSTIYIYKDGEWIPAIDNTVVAEDADITVANGMIDMNAKRIKTVDGKVEAYYANMRVDAEQIRSYVQNRTSDLGTEIKQTAREIRAEAHAAGSSLYSFISMTATQIRAEVGDLENDVFSAITQTASQIRSEVNASKSQFYSSITQTASSIRMEVASSVSGLSSSITQTAKQIRTEVNAANSKVYSNITQTATSIRSDVANDIAGVNSSISQTAGQIRTEVNAANSKIYSNITQTATSIRTEVGNAKSELSSNITQTASSIRSEVNAANSKVYSSITQTASSIRLEVASAKSSLSSSITQTASTIRSEVNAANSKVYSSINQTASSIRLEVASAKSSLSSSITQTASTIRSEVNSANSKIYSSINQTASSIRMEVASAVSGLNSSIDVQKNRISLVVEGTGSNAKIKPASIVSAINNGESSVIISASHINLNGYVKASDITADYIKGKIAAISEMTILRANATTLTIKAAGGSTMNLNTAIYDMRITQDGDVYTLQRKRISNSEWVDVGSFSRATTLSGAWSSGKLTVTASPQGATFDRTVYAKNASATWTDTTASIPIFAKYGTNSEEATGARATIDFSSKIDAAKANVKVNNPALSGYDPSSGIPAERTMTITHDGGGTNNKVLYCKMSIGEWSNNKTLVYAYYCPDSPNAGRINLTRVTVDATSVVDAAKASITINNPTLDNWEGSLPATRTMTITHSGGGTNKKLLYLEIYSGDWSNNKADIYASYRLDSSSATRRNMMMLTVDASSLVTAANRAGRNAVTLADPTSGSTQPLSESQTFTVKTVGRQNSSGVTAELSKDVPLHLYASGWSSGTATVYLKWGATTGSSGNDYAKTTVSMPAGSTITFGTQLQDNNSDKYSYDKAVSINANYAYTWLPIKLGGKTYTIRIHPMIG